jgi:hypothetical protein
MYARGTEMFRATARNIAPAEPYMVQFHRYQRIRTMITKPQPFAQPFADRRVAPAGPRPATTFPGWGPKI